MTYAQHTRHHHPSHPPHTHHSHPSCLSHTQVSKVFSEITAEPVAAASLGQVYKATLRDSGDEVAVKVQRPYVLETVSLDLHLARTSGLLLRALNPEGSKRLDVVALLDEFASNFYRVRRPHTHTHTRLHRRHAGHVSRA